MNEILPASTKLEKQPKPTAKEIADYNSRFVTVRHSTVVACGHKMDVLHFPRHTNCDACWAAFFKLNPEGVAASHDFLQNYGTAMLEKLHGKKFIKQLGKHMQGILSQMYAERQVTGLMNNISELTGQQELS
jgi:hypothetical protein